MAVNTRNKRFAMMGFGEVAAPGLSNPDGAIDSLGERTLYLGDYAPETGVALSAGPFRLIQSGSRRLTQAGGRRLLQGGIPGGAGGGGVFPVVVRRRRH